MPHEIFISYSTQDTKVANDLCAQLEKKGISCWIAPRDVLVSDDWIKEICYAIETCRIVIFLLSSKSNLSEHVPTELRIAKYRCGRKIVPLRIEDVEPAIHLDYILDACQRLDVFPPPLPLHLDKLATDLQQLLAAC